MTTDSVRAEAPATGRNTPLLFMSVFLVALNLRPALTSVGPLLGTIGEDENLSEGLQGLLGALPLLAFAVASPLVHHLSRRLGTERSVLVAMLVLCAGITVRSYADSVGLWVGTMITGCAIAVGNVLVPALVKRDHSSHVSRALGVSSACMTLGAAVASALAVPLSEVTGWRGALALWAVPVFLVAVLWSPRARPAAPVAPGAPPRGLDTPVSVWRQPTAWLVTAFMGLQSTTFYVMVTWLPTIGTSAGSTAGEAGVHLFVFQLAGIASGLAVTRLIRPEGQVAAAVAASAPMLVGVLGLLAAPGLSLLWAAVAGLGPGASLVVGLSLISLRGRTHQETTQLSGMAQSVGYLFAATGPVVTGYLAQATGSWRASLLVIAFLATVQIAVAISAGRVRDREPRPAGKDESEA
ncbi:MFS transporter [Streptodolium elevatio]